MWKYWFFLAHFPSFSIVQIVDRQICWSNLKYAGNIFVILYRVPLFNETSYYSLTVHCKRHISKDDQNDRSRQHRYEIHFEHTLSTESLYCIWSVPRESQVLVEISATVSCLRDNKYDVMNITYAFKLGNGQNAQRLFSFMVHRDRGLDDTALEISPPLSMSSLRSWKYRFLFVSDKKDMTHLNFKNAQFFHVFKIVKIYHFYLCKTWLIWISIVPMKRRTMTDISQYFEVKHKKTKKATRDHIMTMTGFCFASLFIRLTLQKEK